MFTALGHRLAVAVAFVALASVSPVRAQIIAPQVRNFYVGQYWPQNPQNYSTSWEDNSALRPFQKVETALAEVRDFLATTGQSHGEVNVAVAGGHYHPPAPLVFTYADRGTAAYPIRWIAWNGAPYQNDADVFICGGAHLDDDHLPLGGELAHGDLPRRAG